MTRRRWLLLAGVGAVVVALAGGCLRQGTGTRWSDAEVAPRPARIYPDYSGTVVPPNIAPVNFTVHETGTAFAAKISASQGDPIFVSSRSGAILIPVAEWQRLLAANRGQDLYIEVAVLDTAGRWKRFPAITIRIAQDPIDPYLAYRLITPIFNLWHDVGIYQRDLSGCRQTPILEGWRFADGCTNCHTFSGGGTERVSFGIRSAEHGNTTVLVEKGKATKLSVPWGYTSWHPNGRLAAYSANKVRQFFHPARRDIRDVVDLDSDLMLYHADTRTVTSSPAIADPNRLETYPTWSPDGKYLYFCSAPILWSDREAVPPKRYNEVRYDLMRVSYDETTDRWGKPETVLAATTTGLSILLPRISGDGRFLLFCMCQYGCFPAFQASSDLYMMDLSTRRWWKLDINSEESESWHSWSSNSRWIVFSSKRGTGLFTRLYISHVDPNGEVSKPFVLPQQDPEHDEAFVKTYSVPEFLTEPMQVSSRAIAKAVRSDHPVKIELPVTSMTPQAKPKTPDEPWQQPPR